YCKGNQRKAPRPGASPAMAAHTLPLGQTAGRQTSVRKQGTQHTWGGQEGVEKRPPKDGGGQTTQTPRLQNATASADLHHQEERQTQAAEHPNDVGPCPAGPAHDGPSTRGGNLRRQEFVWVSRRPGLC